MNTYEIATLTIALCGMIGTVIAAIVAAMNAKITKNMLSQQKEEYRNLKMPYIVSHNLNLDFPIFNCDEVNEFVEFSELLIVNDEELEYTDEMVLTYSKSLDLKLENIHDGLAKDVKVKVTIPNITAYNNIEYLGKILKFSIDGMQLIIEYDESPDGSKVYWIESSENYLVVLGQTSDNSALSSSVNINIPTAFLILLAIVSNYNMFSDNRDSQLEYPKLKVEIDCEDIIGNRHIFEINYTFVQMKYEMDAINHIKKLNPQYETHIEKLNNI